MRKGVGVGVWGGGIEEGRGARKEMQQGLLPVCLVRFRTPAKWTPAFSCASSMVVHIIKKYSKKTQHIASHAGV